MAHKREHKLEHVLGGIDALNKETIPGIKDIIKTIPSQSDYVKFLKNKIQDFGVAGDDGILEILEEGNYLYITTSNRLLKVNKSDLEIVNSYVTGGAVQFGLCLTTNFVFVGGSKITKLNKSDLSFVSSIDQAAENWLRTDGTYIYTTSGSDLLRFDLDLVAQGTLLLSWASSWIAVYDLGYLYIEHEDIGLTFSKVDVSTFTIALEGDLSASYGGTYVMIAMGAYLYMTAIDASWSNSSVLKIDMATLSFVSETTPTGNYLQGICGDGTYIYYNDPSSAEIYKIDADLVFVESAVTENNNYIGSCADANNIFYGAVINPATWYKYTKTSIAKVAEKAGIAMCSIANNSFCSNGESIFYLQTGIRKLCKLNIETFEVTKSAEIPETYLPYVNMLSCDGEKVYFIAGYNTLTYGGWLFVYDANTLERINMRYWDTHYISAVTVDENYVYVAWVDATFADAKAYVDKLDKNTLADVGLYTGIADEWYEIRDICLTKDYIYIFGTDYSNAVVHVVKINIETMLLESNVDVPLTYYGQLRSGLVCPAQGKFLYFAAYTKTIKINTDDMTYTIYNKSIKGIGAGENHLYLVTTAGSPPSRTETIEVYNPLDFTSVRNITIDYPGLQDNGNAFWFYTTWGRHLFVKDFLLLNNSSWIIRSFVRDSDISDVLGGGVKSVTVLVAASDATETVKASADYVCDGTDDQVQIQAAIDYIKALGGTIGGIVQLSEGNFNVKASIVYGNIACGITLQGSLGSNIVCDPSMTGHIINLTDNAYDIIRDLCFVGNGAAISSAILLQSNTGISCEYNIIENCVFYWHSPATNARIIYLYGGEMVRYNVVRNNMFIGGNSQIEIYGGSGVNKVQRNYFIGNSMRSAGYGLANGSAIALFQGNDNFIEDNLIASPKDYGIDIGAGSFNNIIQGNNIYLAVKQSIYIHGNCDFNLVDGNLVRDGKKQGISIEDTCKGTIISNNIVKDCGQDTTNTYPGIGLAGTCIRNLISGNSISNNLTKKLSHCIYDAGDYNIITDNLCQGALTAQTYIAGANSEVGHNLEIA